MNQTPQETTQEGRRVEPPPRMGRLGYEEVRALREEVGSLNPGPFSFPPIPPPPPAYTEQPAERCSRCRTGCEAGSLVPTHCCGAPVCFGCTLPQIRQVRDGHLIIPISVLCTLCGETTENPLYLSDPNIVKTWYAILLLPQLP